MGTSLERTSDGKTADMAHFQEHAKRITMLCRFSPEVGKLFGWWATMGFKI